jgi:hypothetical protein
LTGSASIRQRVLLAAQDKMSLTIDDENPLPLVNGGNRGDVGAAFGRPATPGLGARQHR